MSNPFDVLGVDRPQGKLTSERLGEIKIAYRRLVMRHHPDKGGDAAKFKEIQSAWEKIERGEYTRTRVRTADLFRHQRADPYLPVVNLECTLKEAYEGFTRTVQVVTEAGTLTGTVNVAPRMPSGHSGVYTLGNGTQLRGVICINGGEFSIGTLQETLRGGGTFDTRSPPIAGTGALGITISTDALDLIIGGWVKVEDFLGVPFSIRIPAGFSPDQKLKARGRGYYDFDVYNNVSVETRGDLFITIRPVFLPRGSAHRKMLSL